MNAFKTNTDHSVDLSSSLRGSIRNNHEHSPNTVDRTQTMNGNGVYMNVIHEPKWISLKKEKLKE